MPVSLVGSLVDSNGHWLPLDDDVPEQIKHDPRVGAGSIFPPREEQRQGVRLPNLEPMPVDLLQQAFKVDLPLGETLLVLQLVCLHARIRGRCDGIKKPPTIESGPVRPGKGAEVDVDPVVGGILGRGHGYPLLLVDSPGGIVRVGK